MSKSYENVPFVKIDIDKFQDLAQKFKITSIPTFLFLKGGDKEEILDRFSGADRISLKRIIDKFISKK